MMDRSIGLAVVAYTWWGLSALYWRQLDSVAPINQLGWRTALGLVTLLAFWVVRREKPSGLWAWRTLAFGFLGAGLAATNWLVFMWAVDQNQAVEASFGYFLMPLFSVALAAIFLGERPRRLQWAAIFLAVVGVVWTVAVLGKVPWVALVLGASFSTYGLVRKQGPLDSLSGLTVELAILAPIGAMLLIVGSETWGDAKTSTVLLLLSIGLFSVAPVLLFAAAARSAPLILIGLLAYLNPILQFLVGWQIFGESVPWERMFGFATIWVALVLVIVDERKLLSSQSIG